jgi:hypothetical protein
MTGRLFRVALMWSGDHETRRNAMRSSTRLAGMFDALAAVGIEAELAVYADEMMDAVREQLLQRCREVMPPSGHWFIIGPLATEPNKPELSLLDRTMLVVTGGRKRKPEEYHALFARAGFKAKQAVANCPPLQILDAVPA